MKKENKYIKLFNEILNYEDFELIRYSPTEWGLIDLQGAYLGYIGLERFTTPVEVLDRLEAYHIDYFEEPVMDFFEIDSHKGYCDLVKQAREKLKNDTEKRYADYYEGELMLLNLIGKAPKIKILNKPFEEIKDYLFYKEDDK